MTLVFTSLPRVSRRRAKLTPLDKSKTAVRRNLITGRNEIWEAATRDGQWAIIRQEDEQTSWDVVHLPTRRVYTHVSSLRAARMMIADGSILRYWDERDANQRSAEAS